MELGQGRCRSRAHLWIPVIVIGTAGTAAMIRRLRANLLDELQKQYVVTARAKGLHPFKVLFKYPLRLALNPFISDIGSLLPHVISGAAVVSIVMSLPTTGPMLLEALRSQDMFLAGSFLMFMAFLTVIGVFLSDLALAALDPRIRLQTGRSRMSEIGLTAGAAPPDKSGGRGGARRRADAALRLAGAVRPLCGRGDDGGAGALLPGAADPVDVVAAAAAPGGRGLRRDPARAVRDDPVLRVPRALRARQPPCRSHLRAAAGAFTSSTTAGSSGPMSTATTTGST